MENIKINHFLLRKLNQYDDNDLIELRSNLIDNIYNEAHSFANKAEVQQYIKDMNYDVEDNLVLFYGIEDTRLNKIIGIFSLFNFNNPNSSLEIGFEINTNFQKKGCMNIILPYMIKYIHDKLFYNEINVCINKDNIKAIKLVDKFAFIIKYTDIKYNFYKHQEFTLR